MSIYSNKKRWKWLLFFSAVVAFFVIIYYSNVLMNSIAKDELNKVHLWVDAIYHKAELVNYTEKFFENVRIEERKKAALLAQAIQKVNDSPYNEDITFYSEIIISNSAIPLIIVGKGGKIDYYSANLGDDIANIKNIAELGDRITEYDSIKIQYYKEQYIQVYYKESEIYTNLRIVLDNLIQSFFQEVVINVASVPVIITDSTSKTVIAFGNLDSAVVNDSHYLHKTIETMRNQNPPLKIELTNKGNCYVFYQESSILTKLRYFPYVQFFVVGVFLIVAYLLFSFARRSEQNQVWVGMSKETAHQLGTPISSLMAWNELLKDQHVDPSIINEIDKDVYRLETIAQRFSKIGSVPELKDENLVEILEEFIAYFQTRVSSKVTIKFTKPEKTIILPLNKYLFEWVIENLCKNSIDAMDGCGMISIDITEEGNLVYVDVTDTGKGIPGNKQKTIFKPGYTSRSRGWGLGLTLAKRIMKEYHKGKLFVKSSVMGKGTVMRIVLKKK